MPYLPKSRLQPPIAPIHSWEVPKQPWNHFHLDFAGPFLGNMFLVLIDAYCKWLDIIVMKSITTTAMVDQLRLIFATHGLLLQLSGWSLLIKKSLF